MRHEAIGRSGNEQGEAVYDVVGIGFGPSNLALALTIREEAGDLRSLFLERRGGYDWHPGMLLEGAQVQISFLKDLVTLRNPQSHFTFINYLQRQGRLLDFVNLRTFFPTRIEFNDYFRWVAEQLSDQVRYDREVLEIQPVEKGDGLVSHLRIVARRSSGETEEYLTRNLVIATGGVPMLPAGIKLGEDRRVFHSQDFLRRVTAQYPDANAPYRFVVVGSGQSAAEIFHYLFSQYPRADVTAALRRFAYKPADESAFVNEIFAPATTDLLFSMPEAERLELIRTHADTNYSAVDLELIQTIYKTLYERRVAGNLQARVRPFLELQGVEPASGGLVAKFQNKVTRKPEQIEADGLILATGYQRNKSHPLLGDLAPYLLASGTEGYWVDRDYRIGAQPTFRPKVFLQGFCEDTHGLSDTLLSVLPVRSQEILASLLQIEEEAPVLSAVGAVEEASRV
jgi:L-ornithine N5-monooxygenase